LEVLQLEDGDVVVVVDDPDVEDCERASAIRKEIRINDLFIFFGCFE